MIKSLHIENFRCFEKLNLSDFGLVNVVVGDNGTGKTAFLESMFLPGGDPALVFRLRQWRGLIQPIATASASPRDLYESLWKDLFFGLNQSNPIKISSEGSPENKRELRIYYTPVDVSPLLTNGNPPQPNISGIYGLSSDSSATIPITFETTDADERKYILRPQITPAGTVGFSGNSPPARVNFFASNYPVDPVQVATMFSELSKHNLEEKVSEELQTVFPTIRSLSVLAPGGNLGVYCTTPGIDEKISVNLVSAGIYKLLGYLLSIANSSGGVVLLDEIENGFYYKALPLVWASIIHFCKEYNVQVFASTHSWECLEALREPLAKDEKRFRLLRTERKNGGCDVRISSGVDFLAALETGVEIR